MNKVPDSVCKELAALVAKPEGEMGFSDPPALQRKKCGALWALHCMRFVVGW
jgi:hypothetical protein